MFEFLDQEQLETLITSYAIPWGLKIVQAVLIFVIGRIIASIVVRVVRRVLKKSGLDEMLVGFISSILGFLLTLVVVIAALRALGVDTTSLVALIGAAGLAIGLALQGSLQNFASGALLVLFKPISRGEYVEIAGVAGSVEEIRIFHTTLKTPDNKLVVVPNGEIYNGVITNYSRNRTRRVDMVFGIGYGDDIDQARTIIEGVLAADDRILKDPAPVVALDELADSSVNFVVRPWVATPDYFAVKWSVTEAIKKAFDAQGVSIPFPQHDVHLHRPSGED